MPQGPIMELTGAHLVSEIWARRPNRAVNADAPVRGGNLANVRGGAPVTLYR